jgi:uncharacterized lipoprotein YddW (UPF0748 family)
MIRRGYFPITFRLFSRQQSPKAILFLLAVLVFFLQIPLFAVTYEPGKITAPTPLREFRGMWITTVANLSWPSKTNFNTAQQKADLLAILDRAVYLKMNAVVFQVRPACDALYASRLEPWSEFLTGKMGKAPHPYYDPLEFIIAEAHKRGLELHAWFNPYRASHHAAVSSVATNHISKTKPQLVRRYGTYLWLDPGEREVQDHIINVVQDVVRRYDVDGVHFDDYFYPDPAYARGVEFPDNSSWNKYGGRSGLNRDDWRRENVNAFILRAHVSIKALKPWVKFGISPHGIWRPGHPPQISGSDNFELLYADSRKWLTNGWLDYFAPQLYWPIGQKAQSFSALLDWWNTQNVKQRHIWPGLYSYKTLEDWQISEIVNQVRLAAKQPVSSGHVHYDARPLVRTTVLADALVRGPYSEPAMVPASPWMGRSVTNQAQVNFSGLHTGNLRVTAKPAQGERVSRWILQTLHNGKWSTEILNGDSLSRQFGNGHPEGIVITPIDRFGNAGRPYSLEYKSKPTRPTKRTTR